MSEIKAQCARCGISAGKRVCQITEGRGSEGCPTEIHPEMVETALNEYDRPGVAEFAREAAVQEGRGYGRREAGYAHVRPDKTRIEEIMEFAARMGFSRLGLAFCIGLRDEARKVEKLFVDRGFSVVSVICKVGRVPKERIGVSDADKIAIGEFESMCNPILQAQILNRAQTQLNVLLGLCVGHDALFLKYADAPCTVLAVKDRVLGHNPLAAVYQMDSYYRSLKTDSSSST